MNLHLTSKVYLKYTFLNWYIYFQTQKYTWSGLSKFMYLHSESEVYILQVDLYLK